MKLQNALLCFLLGITLFASAQKDPVDYVNPLIGTLSKPSLSTGNTYPAIARPWGMNFWTPQTADMNDTWTYTYTADKIKGFKQTHQPSPWIGDYGQFSIMPVTGGKKFTEQDRASWFSHKSEIATPYYYSVYLADHDVKAEFTPTERAVAFRFTFPESNESYIVVDAFDKGSYIKIIPGKNTIEGYTTKNRGGVTENFKNYFVIVFDKPFLSAQTWQDNTLEPTEKELKASHVGSIVGFKTHKGEIINVRIASSFISIEQAYQNLEEIGQKDFETVKSEGRAQWNNILSRVKVEGGDLDQYRTFYSSLYRTLLFPRKLYEIDKNGNKYHYSPFNGNICKGPLYTDSGFWDTFRSLFPFLNLMFPSQNAEIQQGLINTYLESGFLPEWASPGHRDCMVGNNSASIVTDAFLKNIGTYNADKGSFRTWLYQIARNTVIDHYRSEKETKSIEDAWDLVSPDDTSVLADKNIQIEQVKKYLQVLKSEQRDIVIMRLWQDMSYKEIAEILGKSEASCKMSFSRSLKELQKIMPEAMFLSLLCYGFHSLVF